MMCTTCLLYTSEHRALFFGEDETLEFRHFAASRRIFAAGAVRALDFAVGRAPGLYRVDDVLGLNDIRGCLLYTSRCV